MLVHFIITSIQSCEWESKQSPRVSKCQNVSKKLTRSGEDPRLWYYELRQRTSKLAKSRRNLENLIKLKKSWFFPVHLLGQISIYLTSAFFRICCANQILIISFHFSVILILDFFWYVRPGQNPENPKIRIWSPQHTYEAWNDFTKCVELLENKPYASRTQNLDFVIFMIFMISFSWISFSWFWWLSISWYSGNACIRFACTSTIWSKLKCTSV